MSGNQTAVTVYMPEALYERARLEAFTRRESLSAYVRRAVEAQLDAEAAQP